MAARRAAGVARPWVGTLVRDVAPLVWACFVIPILVYLASWLPWIASETGTDRHVTDAKADSVALVALLPDWLPDWVRGMAYFSSKVLEFHATLFTPRGNPHPWESKPWTWPMGLRPMLYYYESGAGATGCGSNDCVGAVMAIGTPALWWTAFPVLGWGVWRWITRRDWRYAAVLVGYGAGILPWFTDIDRQMYFFYMTPVIPFLVLAVVARPRGDPRAADGGAGTAHDGPHGGRALRRARRGELRVAVADPRRRLHHGRPLERGALAALLAMRAITGETVPKQKRSDP